MILILSRGIRPSTEDGAVHWTITTLTDPTPPDPAAEPPMPDPADADLQPPADAHSTPHPTDGDAAPAVPIPDEPADTDHTPPDPAETYPQPPGSAEQPVPTQRILDALAAAHAFYTTQAARSWVPDYLTRRGLPAQAAGYAPAGWATLADHLRAHGFTEDELKAAGLAKTSRRGTLIDVFRDRAVLPIHTPDGHVAAFIGRLPDTNHDDHTPKYLNSPGTAVYSKSLLPYGLTPATVAALRAGADLAITEGPMDALAITSAAHTAGLRLVAVATNGTALTPGQLDTLNTIAALTDRTVILAMDSDHAGRAAAIRAYPLLRAAGITDPHTVTWSAKDPAQTLTDRGPAHLAALLEHPRPLADAVVDDIVSRWPTHDETPESRAQALNEAAPVVAAMPAPQRARQTVRLADILHYQPDLVTTVIDRHRPIPDLHLPTRPSLSAPSRAALRHAHIRDQILAVIRANHPALAADPYLPRLTETLHHAIELDYNATTRLPRLAEHHPLDPRHPAQDLEFRLLQDFPASYQPPQRRPDTTTPRTGPPAPPHPPGPAPTLPAPAAPTPRR